MDIKNVLVIAPYHYDHIVATLVEGLHTLGVKVFSNSDHNYVKPANVMQSTMGLKRLSQMTDVVVLAHSALESKYAGVIQPILGEIKAEVFCDGSDYSDFEANPSDYKLYLKRELNKENIPPKSSNVEPFIFGVEKRYSMNKMTDFLKMWHSKTENLACIMSCCPKREWRFDIVKALEEAFGHDERYFIGEYRDGEALKTVDTGDRHFSGYFQKLLSAQISVDSWGCGQARQTGRFWESLANGCLVMYQKIDPYIWPEPFVEDYHFVVYENPTDLVDKAKFYAEHQLDARKIAERGYDYMLRHHTTQARGKQFLSLIDKYL